MGFNATWFAKAAVYALLALVAGFAGSVYFGTKLLAPADEAKTVENRSAQSGETRTVTAVPPVSRERAEAPKDVEPVPVTANERAGPAERNPAPATQVRPDVRQPVTPSARNQASRDEFVRENRRELRLGQQERRRLRAERRKNLENANARVNQRPGKLPPDHPRDEPFFPFRF